MNWSRRFKAGALVGTMLVCGLAGLVLVPGWRHYWRELLPPALVTQLNGYRLGYRVNHSTRIVMPDGIRLATSVYLPTQHASRELATIYIRHPYGRSHWQEGLQAAQYFSSRGYAVVIQDIRGKHDSEGEFIPYRHATSDGAASLDWIVSQPWSNGRVGTFGCSALGELQFSLARARHPAHAAMIPMGAGGAMGSALGRYSYFGVFEGGIFQLASGFGWFLNNGAKRPGTPVPAGLIIAAAIRGLPVSALMGRITPEPNGYEEFVRSPLDAPFWKSLDYVSAGDVLTTPMLVINTWGDQTIGDTLALADFVRQTSSELANRNHRVVIGPGNHCDHEGVAQSGEFGEIKVKNADRAYYDMYLAWFDYWLRSIGNGLLSTPGFTYFMIGENRWLTSSRWPPETSRTERWYLGSSGHANSSAGNGTLAPLPGTDVVREQYRYDPNDPVPSVGGPLCCTGNAADRPGPADQRLVEQRLDVLVFTSAPLRHPLRIAGTLKANLFVSSSGRDTDFVARLVHVWPDGRATSIQEGALRARYRQGFDKPALLKPGQVVNLTVEMRSIAYHLPAGHRLRLDVTSSSFPRLERNLNTGGPNASEANGNIVVNELHHGGNLPSYLEFQALPGTS